jgi:hypothetical protein
MVREKLLDSLYVNNIFFNSQLDVRLNAKKWVTKQYEVVFTINR